MTVKLGGCGDLWPCGERGLRIAKVQPDEATLLLAVPDFSALLPGSSAIADLLTRAQAEHLVVMMPAQT